MKPIKNNRCHELGVCQGLSADQCPDCDSWECELPLPPDGAQAFLRGVSVEEMTPQPGRRATDRAPLPTYPFAPGTIQGPELPISYVDDDGWFAGSPLREALGIMALVAVVAALGTALVRWLV